MIEREVKIRVPDLEELRPRLEAMGATYVGVEEEINHILDTAEGALQRNGQILRVRAADKNTLTWKGRPPAEDPYGHKVREELEVPFSSDTTDTMLGIFSRLGFQEALRYTKTRMSWRWQSVVIALDRLDFGSFIEIEGDASAIQHALHLLQIEHLPFETRSYPELQRLARQEQ
jgi:predicted adenylyl cyclase CyaB